MNVLYNEALTGDVNSVKVIIELVYGMVSHNIEASIKEPLEKIVIEYVNVSKQFPDAKDC